MPSAAAETLNACMHALIQHALKVFSLIFLLSFERVLQRLMQEPVTPSLGQAEQKNLNDTGDTSGRHQTQTHTHARKCKVAKYSYSSMSGITSNVGTLCKISLVPNQLGGKICRSWPYSC